jgi:hypothetical protein
MFAMDSVSSVDLFLRDSQLKRRTEMGRIVISENVSIDGVVQDPTGEEGFKHGGWFAQVGDKDREERAKVIGLSDTAALERHQPPPRRGRDCLFVPEGVTPTALPLLKAAGR